MRKHTLILGILSALLLLVGFFFQKFQLKYWPIVLGSGTVLFLVGFITSFIIDRISTQSRRSLHYSIIILSQGIGFLILGAVLKIFHLPGALIMTVLGVILSIVYFLFLSGFTEGRKLMIRKDRQLATILFTDIVGFTALMGKDEDLALRVLDQNRRIQQRVIRKNRGKWLKELGDGSLVIFYTATEAVNAAIEIQRLIGQTNNFKVRMGIHISEIVFTDSDVFGDGVNVASRISDQATADEIFISDAVFRNIRNREKIDVQRVGDLSLKNVPYTVMVYKIDMTSTSLQLD